MADPTLVAGAGIAGLVIARDLARAGLPVEVIEAAERVGGQLDAVEVGGVAVDAGAESFATRSDEVGALAAELGLAVAPPLGSPAWVVAAGGDAFPLPAAAVLGIPADPAAPDVVAAIGAAAAARAARDARTSLPDPDRYATLGDLVRERMGAVVLDRLVAPVVRGVYSVGPDALPLDAASPGLRAALAAHGSLGAAVSAVRESSPAGSQVAAVVGGMHRLAAALSADAVAAGARLRLGARVESVAPDGLVLAGGERLAGRVVVAAPGLASAPTRRRRIVVAIAAVDAPGLDAAPRGTGALVAEAAAGITARAFTHASAKWAWLGTALPPHRHLVRLSYDGMPEDPAATVLADLRAITGADIARLEDLALRPWLRTLVAEPAPAGLLVAGEAASGTGLATIVPRARALARGLIERAPTGGSR